MDCYCVPTYAKVSSIRPLDHLYFNFQLFYQILLGKKGNEMITSEDEFS